jgi:hypothetical protein
VGGKAGKGPIERPNRGPCRRNNHHIFHVRLLGPAICLLCIANCRECEAWLQPKILRFKTSACVYAAQHFFAANAKMALQHQPRRC